MTRPARPFIRPALLLALSLAGACRSFATDTAPAAPAITPDSSPQQTTLAAGEVQFWKAVSLLESGHSKNFPAGQALLREAVAQRYIHAQVLLGNCLLSGSYGFKRDPRKAVALFLEAAARHNAYALASLGQCHLTGTGVRKDLTKAAGFLESALKPDADYARPTPPAGSAQPNRSAEYDTAGALAYDPAASTRAAAHFQLALILQERGDHGAAHPHFEAAARGAGNPKSGIYNAALRAALDYAFGNGVPRDMAQSSAMLDLARKLGVRASLSSIHNNVSLKIANDLVSAEYEEELAKSAELTQQKIEVGIAQALGDPKSKYYNIGEAIKWYELAAEGGQPWAMLQLAFLYSRGDCGKPEPEKAFAWFEKAGGGDKPKHNLATANLAICLYRGIGTAPDIERATALFTKHQAFSMICYLGAIRQCPATITTYEEDFALTRSRAEQGDARATFLLGLRYKDGWDAKPDLKKAADCIRRSARTGDEYAQNELGLIYEFNRSLLGEDDRGKALRQAYEWYGKSAAQNNTDAIANVANIEAVGWISAPNLDSAEKLYQRGLAIDPKHARLRNGLGLLYQGRLEQALEKKNEALASKLRSQMLETYQRAADTGYPYASYLLGDLYYRGKLVPRDNALAYRYFSDAAEHGLKRAHFELGLMHENGEGVRASLEEAAYHYRLAALDGESKSAQVLCELYIGIGGRHCDYTRALFWAGVIEKRGVRNLYFGGCGGAYGVLAASLIREGQYDEAFELCTRLAAMPDSYPQGIAYRNLSILYANGWGVPKDAKQARNYRRRALQSGNTTAKYDEGMELLAKTKNSAGRKLLEESAKAGCGEANYQLAQLYRHDGGTTPDKIAELVKFAADCGCIEARLERAAETLAGAPKAPSLEEALRFVRDAADGDNPEAQRLLSELEKRLSAPADTAEDSSAGARSS